MILVKIINGIPDIPAKSGYTSWLEYWEEKREQRAGRCHNNSCNTRSGLVGAHVRQVNFNNGILYVVPLCPRCNNIDKEFYAVEPLVPDIYNRGQR